MNTTVESQNLGSRVSTLSDADLLVNTCRLVGRTNCILAELLAHLGEVEARGLHRHRACSSLYIYCVRELRFSEDAAHRRVNAARWVRRFPALLGAVARGELHLTAVLQLGPHLTEQNHLEVMARAQFRTKKEIAELVRQLAPLPDVPARVEPLGPVGAASATPEHSANPSWHAFAQSMAPVVRVLEPGLRPADWIDDVQELDVLKSYDATIALARAPLSDGGNGSTPAPAWAPLSHRADSSTFAPARDPQPFAGPQRFMVQFTASEEYVSLLEQAKALLSHAVPNAGLEELHLRAMRTFVAELQKRKYAARPTASTGAGRTTSSSNATPTSLSSNAMPNSLSSDAVTTSSRDATTTDRFGRAGAAAVSKREAPRSPSMPVASAAALDSSSRLPTARGRHIPAAVRRAVYERDGARCTFVDTATGRRCAETHTLELHHEVPFARGGAHAVDNLTLRCRAHNALAAERDYGGRYMAQRNKSPRHESYARVR